jgi:hypothetical protein
MQLTGTLVESQLLLNEPMGEIEALRLIHKMSLDTVLSFCFKKDWFKKDETMRNLGNISVDELEEKFHLLDEYRRGGFYVGINSTYSQWLDKNGNTIKRKSKQRFISELPNYGRKASDMHYLNAVAVDLDGYSVGIESFYELRCRFMEALIDAKLPQPSLLADSGRGAWGIWLLRDEQRPNERPTAHQSARQLCQRINKRAVQVFSSLGADPKCTDASRVMRCPGTFNPKNGKPVQFYRVSDREFTMRELAVAFGVRTQKTSLLPDSKATKNPRRQAAGHLRWSVPLQGFRDLWWRVRGTFTEGMRSTACLWYAVLMRKNRLHENEIQREVLRMADSCVPKLEHEKALLQYESSKRIIGRIGNEALASHLKITPRERQMLPCWFKPQKVRMTRADYESERLAGRNARINKVSEMLMFNPSLTCREIAASLGCSPQTVANMKILSNSVLLVSTSSSYTQVNTVGQEDVHKLTHFNE